MVKLNTQHLLTIRDLSREEILALVERAAALKAGWPQGQRPRPLADQTVALLFEKPSTRTRVSFEVAVSQLGGHSLFLNARDTQIGRDEPLADTARVMSRYVDALVVRTFGQNVVQELARWGRIPVINALTDQYHPCQVLSDLLTVSEIMGDVTQPVYCWIGDGNNMLHSWLEAAGRLGLTLNIACPKGFTPDPPVLEYAQDQGARVNLSHDPAQAMAGAQIISTDVWASMGHEHEHRTRMEAFGGFSLTPELLALADPGARVLHCLPAHRGEEISEEVLEGPQAVVWDQAENRLHMQKAILEALLGRDNQAN